jgi:hypothetical protein
MMKYEIGDKIVVLHSNEEGEVIDIINDKMVMIEVRGVRFPAYMDQIDFPYFKRFTEKKLFPPKKQRTFIEDMRKETAVSKVADGVWLSFLPKFESDEFGDDVVVRLKTHLINRTEAAYNFIYHLNFFGKSEFELKGEIHAFADFYLHDVAFEDMNDSPAFVFEFSLYHPDKNKADYFEANVKLKPRQLFDRIEELKKKNEATFTYKLFDQFPNKPYNELADMQLPAKGVKVYSLKDIRQHLQPARSVVDLHIEKLTDNWKQLSNLEILGIQLREFEKWYELALAHKQSQLTIIHGIGSGKLRDEIHDILRLKKEVKSFVNQYHPSFGYGATEIYFS